MTLCSVVSIKEIMRMDLAQTGSMIKHGGSTLQLHHYGKVVWCATSSLPVSPKAFALRLRTYGRMCGRSGCSTTAGCCLATTFGLARCTGGPVLPSDMRRGLWAGCGGGGMAEGATAACASRWNSRLATKIGVLLLVQSCTSITRQRQSRIGQRVCLVVNLESDLEPAFHTRPNEGSLKEQEHFTSRTTGVTSLEIMPPSKRIMSPLTHCVPLYIDHSMMNHAMHSEEPFTKGSAC